MSSWRIPHVVAQLARNYPGNHSNQGSIGISHMGIPHLVPSRHKKYIFTYVPIIVVCSEPRFEDTDKF
jgi:hypothetical protein